MARSDGTNKGICHTGSLRFANVLKARPSTVSGQTLKTWYYVEC